METNIENIILKPLRRFALQKPNSSVLLFLATILAMILANSPLQDRYHHFLQFPISLTAGEFGFFTHHGQPLSMLAFVNDALMAVFFFTIGLEIKQDTRFHEEHPNAEAEDVIEKPVVYFHLSACVKHC